MVAPGFGFSFSDIALAIKVTVKVCEAFKEQGGAAEKYQDSVAFLEGFKTTLEHLEHFAQDKSGDPYADDIARQCEQIEQPWLRFQAFVDKYEAYLGKNPVKPAIAKVPKIALWTFKDMSGGIQKFKTATTQPLGIIKSLLSLQTM